MADIRVSNEYITIKRDGVIEICEYFESARIETQQELIRANNIEDVIDALPIPENGMMEKNKVYQNEDMIICPKENISINDERIIDDKISVIAKSIKTITPIKIK